MNWCIQSGVANNYLNIICSKCPRVTISYVCWRLLRREMMVSNLPDICQVHVIQQLAVYKAVICAHCMVLDVSGIAVSQTTYCSPTAASFKLLMDCPFKVWWLCLRLSLECSVAQDPQAHLYWASGKAIAWSLTVRRSQSLGCTLRSSTYLGSAVSSFLKAVACHSPHNWVSGLYIHFRLWTHVIYQYIGHCLCFVVVNTTAFIWESAFTCTVRRDQPLGCNIPAFRLVQLLAHFCRLLLVKVHTNQSLGCT